jgi:trigger factor
MNIEEIKNENLEIHLKVKIESKNAVSKYTDELASVAKKIKMPGFRPGKVPLNLIETKYGKAIYSDISSKLIEETIEKVLKEKNINPSSQPHIDDIKNILGQDIEFVIKIEHLPTITLPDFKKIKLEKQILEVNDKDIENELKEIFDSHPSYKEKKGKASDGDKVMIDFVGRIDDKEFKGGSAKDIPLILGSKSMIPGFEEQILDHKAGDEFTIKVQFPSTYHSKECAGKDAEFDIKLNEVLKPQKSEVNDESTKAHFGFDNLELMKNDIKDKLINNYKEQVDVMTKMRLFDEFEELLDFEIPKTLFQNEYNSIKVQTENDKDFQEDLKDKSEKDIEKYYTKIANRRVKIALLISEYAKLKNITVSQDELRNEILKRIQSMPGYEKAMMDFYSKHPRASQELIGALLEDKVVRMIIEQEITLVEKTLSKDKLDKMIDKENSKKLIA